MNLTKKRWLILIVSCIANLCFGSIYTWSIFASSMAEHLSAIKGTLLTTADLAIVYTIANSVGPITMISGGWFNDKFGSKSIIFISGIMWGLGMFISGFANSVTFLIISYGLIGGLGLGMGYGALINTCQKFFPDKRGLIGGITTAVYGLGSVILPPIIIVLVNKFDVSTTFKIVGIVFTVIIVGSSFFMEKCPDNFVPDGWTPPNIKSNNNTTNKNWKEMLSSPIFYIMLILLTCGAFSGMMIISQASAVARNMVGMSAIAASSVISVL